MKYIFEHFISKIAHVNEVKSNSVKFINIWISYISSKCHVICSCVRGFNGNYCRKYDDRRITRLSYCECVGLEAGLPVVEDGHHDEDGVHGAEDDEQLVEGALHLPVAEDRDAEHVPEQAQRAHQRYQHALHPKVEERDQGGVGVAADAAQRRVEG